MLKIEPGNETLTDGQTDGRTDRQTGGRMDTQTQIFFGGYNIIPRTFLSGGGKKITFFFSESLNFSPTAHFLQDFHLK